MKAMMAGFAAMVLISVGAYFALQEAGFSAAEQGSGDNVRLD
ncbi:hypothetical protein [Pseudaestuariivita sp.]